MARGSAGTLILRVASNGISFLTGLVLARLLGPATYGLYVYSVTWLSLLVVPAALGLDMGLVRFVAEYLERKQWSELQGLLRLATWSSLLTSVLITSVALLTLAFIPGLSPTTRLTLGITIGLLPISVSTIIRQAVLRGFKRVILAQVPDTLVQPGILLCLLILGHLLWRKPSTAPAVAGLNGVAMFVSLASVVWLLHRELTPELRASHPSYKTRLWIRTLLPLVLIGVIQILVNRVDILLVGSLMNPQDIGIYAVARRGAEMVLFIIDATSLAGAPLLASRYAAGDREGLRSIISLTAHLNFWFSAPICLALFVGAPWFMQLFGVGFTRGYNVLRVLTLAHFLSAMAGAAGQTLYMTGYQRDVAAVMIAAAVLNTLLNAALISTLGIMGAAIATGITIVLFKVALVIVIYKRLGVVSTVFDFRRLAVWS